MATEKHLTKDDIQHLPEAQRMLQLEMYTGNKKQKPREEWLYNFSEGVIRREVITLSECLERCYMEPLTNASDNVGCSRRFGVDPGDIYVFIGPERIVIENYGTPIPTEFKEEEEMYTPELSFGVPGSSSHFKGTRHEAGVNGLGVKLTNGFSKRFEIEIDNHLSHQSYRQGWVGMGLEGCQTPEITPYGGKSSRVRVTFEPEYAHFGYPNAQAPRELFHLFARHCADISYTTRVPVRLECDMDGEHIQTTFDLDHPREYARLYFGEDVEHSILHYEWPKGTRVVREEDGRQRPRDPHVIPLVEMCVIDAPESGTNISFVNSMMTRDGGSHVEAAIKPVSDHIVNMVHALSNKEGGGITVNLSHVRPNISLILSCRVEDPSFSGQTKNKLSGPDPFVPKIKISKEEMEPVKEWNIIHNLKTILEAKKNAMLSRTDGKKRRNISTKNGRDANEAGTKKSGECTLYIVEGLSASSYPKKLIDNMENGPDFCGILPIRGKFLNVMRAKFEQIAKNKEIEELKKMLGLKRGTDYSNPENFKKLRYGKVVIMADSDDDGKHIVALLLLYFHCQFPSLLQIGYVYNYLTPIIRVTKGKRSHKFYTYAEYEKWKRRTKTYPTWKHMYFKGLGRTTDAQIKEDFYDQHVIHCIYDDYAPYTIRLAFAKKFKDERKAWLAHFGKALNIDVVEERQPISEFLNTELVKFGLLSLSRAIPKLTDGFKDAQRKIMWGAFQIWDTEKMGKIKPGNSTYKEVKVARIAADVAGKTNYHHGEKSLESAIVAMAQYFTGSNNLPYFTRDGQFGCVAPDTPVLLWNGDTILARDVQVGQELIGDDGQKRTVSRVVSGLDNMYEISQTFGDPYIVNSIHILTLMVPSHKNIFWKESTQSCVMTMHYYDRRSQKVKSKIKYLPQCHSIKDDAYQQIKAFRDTIPDDNVVDIRLSDYLRLSDNQKKFFFGFKPHKRTPATLSKNPYVSKIKVKPVGLGKYCGWTIDGNERFLLGDSTVTHNTRDLGGKDAAESRYAETRPEWWIPYVFRREDLAILKIKEDEGMQVEPDSFYPIVPPALMNGCNGIATAYSTFIPNHNPLDIVHWLKCKIQGKELPKIIPWYRGFSGTIEVIDRRARRKRRKGRGRTPLHIEEPASKVAKLLRNKEEQEEEKEEEEGTSSSPETPSLAEFNDEKGGESEGNKKGDLIPGYMEELAEHVREYQEDQGRPLYSLISKGEFYTNTRGQIVITELPIYRWTHPYFKWLEKLRDEDKLLKDIRNISKSDIPGFELTGFKPIPSYKSLNLQFQKGMSNMVLLDEAGKPQRFDSAAEILEAFYLVRLRIYGERKAYILKVWRAKIPTLHAKRRFIQAVAIDKTLVIENRPRDVIHQEMDAMALDHALLSTRLVKLSQDEINHLHQEIVDLETDIATLEETSPEQLYLRELQEFERAYRKHYKLASKGDKIRLNIKGKRK